jgi:hypothetical protein
MNTNDIPPHYLSRDAFPPDNGMTPLEWAAYIVAAAAAAGFGVFMLLQAAGVL